MGLNPPTKWELCGPGLAYATWCWDMLLNFTCFKAPGIGRPGHVQKCSVQMHIGLIALQSSCVLLGRWPAVGCVLMIKQGQGCHPQPVSLLFLSIGQLLTGKSTASFANALAGHIQMLASKPTHCM